jgi:DNA polymerase-3 subunit delta'
MLSGAVESDKVAHAYIFHGPEGVGKKFAAVTLAMTLNCKTGGERPCGECPVCRRIDKGIHPDVALVQPDGANIRISQVREIEGQLAMGVYEGEKRVYIFDPADAMSLEASNAFLKTLEEPPADTIFVLITDKLDSLLPTITSRCQLVPFTALRRDDVAGIVSTQTGLEPDKAALAASYVRGRLGAALSMDVDGFIELREGLLEKWFRLSPDDGGKLLELSTALTAAVRAADKTGMQPLDILITWFRDLALLKSGAQTDTLVHRDMMDVLRAEQGKYSLNQLNECFQALHDTLSLLNDTNVNKELALTAMLVRMLKVKREGAGEREAA